MTHLKGIIQFIKKKDTNQINKLTICWLGGTLKG
jgi:hypothetical protein